MFGVCGYLAHARRNFTDAIDAIRNAEKRFSSPAMIGNAYFDKLFEIERNISAFPPDERKLKQQKLSLPVLNELRNWAAKLNAPSKSLQGKAAAHVQALQEKILSSKDVKVKYPVPLF